MEIADEIPTIEILGNSVVKTKKRRYYIVEPTDSNQQYVIRNFHDLKVTINDEMSIDLVSENFLVGLAATKTGEYDSDYFGTVTPYDAIEIKYINPSKALSAEKFTHRNCKHYKKP